MGEKGEKEKKRKKNKIKIGDRSKQNGRKGK
jgi:hypothetical protein